jgi:Lon protease-like protein
MSPKKSIPEGPVEIPEFLPILPLRNSVLFPNSIIPIDVGRKKSVKLVEEAIAKEKPIIGIVTQRDARVEEPGPADLYTVGCAARILKVIKLAKDSFSVILQGVSRVRLLELGPQDPYMVAKIQVLPDPTASSAELDALVVNVKDVAKRVAERGIVAARQRQRAGAARRPHHVEPRRTGGREAGDSRNPRSQGALASRAAVPVAPARGAEGAGKDQYAGAGGNGAQSARVRPAPAAQGH